MSRYTITQAAAERLLRDLDIAVVKTMSRVVADAREHLWLLENINTTDVLTDTDFQRRLCRHVGMRGKLRMRRKIGGFRSAGAARTRPAHHRPGSA